MFFSSKRGFSLIELLVSLIIISCVMTAMAPVITKKMSHNDIVISEQSAQAIQSATKGQNIEELLDVLKDCKLNQDKTKLICEVEISQKNDYGNENLIDKKTNVTYSQRRDKIRFKTASNSGYKTTSVSENTDTDLKSQDLNQYQDIIKEFFDKAELEIPIEDNNLLVDDYKQN